MTISYEDATEFDQGWTEAAMSLVAIWNNYNEMYQGDPVKVTHAMDAFFEGVTSRLEGGSVENIAKRYKERMAEAGLDA